MKKPFALRHCLSALALVLFASPLFGQVDRTFTVPLADLQTWAHNVVVSFKAQVTGHSAVHGEASDCEMHLGAKLIGYRGDPPGWVLEPMNLCLELLPKKGITSKAKWTEFGDTLVDQTITGSGIPRIWPEHLEVDPAHIDTNPAHATEIHPLVDLKMGSNTFDFSSFLYAPEALAGIKPKTARGILTNTDVTVKEENGSVEITMSSGTIGNFAVVQITVDTDTIQEKDGSHFMDGLAVADNEEPTDVRLVTARGSDINDTIAKMKTGKRKHVSMESLVLFSLNPEALLEAAQKSKGKDVKVQTPIELIVYGTPRSEE